MLSSCNFHISSSETNFIRAPKWPNSFKFSYTSFVNGYSLKETLGLMPNFLA